MSVEKGLGAVAGQGSSLGVQLWGKTGRPSIVGGRTTIVAGLVALLAASYSHGQQLISTCVPNNGLLAAPGPVSIYPTNWSPGHTYNVSITGAFPVGGSDPGCSNVSLSVWEWPQYPNPKEIGGSDPNVNLSDLTWVSPTLMTFTVTVGSGDPNQYIGIAIRPSTTVAPLAYLDFWGISLQPPPPPNGPGPQPCTPVITSVNPDKWEAGQTYPVQIRGSGFVTPQNGTFSCPATNTFAVDVDTGSVAITDVTVVSPTLITATVKPADTDPDEDAEVTLYLPNPNDNVVRGPLSQSQFAPSIDYAGIPSGYVAGPNVPATVTNPEVIVVAWVNPNAPDLLAMVAAGPTTKGLKKDLNSTFSCWNLLRKWAGGAPTDDVQSRQDALYADAFLLHHTGNNPPPPTLSNDAEDAFLVGGDYRLFNRFGGDQTAEGCDW